MANERLTDAEYWKQFETQMEDVNENIGPYIEPHRVRFDVCFKFKIKSFEEFNYPEDKEIVYETKQENINCNPKKLKIWFKNVKKVIRMVDEAHSGKDIRDDEEEDYI